jgi:hypothetical protein
MIHPHHISQLEAIRSTNNYHTHNIHTTIHHSSNSPSIHSKSSIYHSSNSPSIHSNSSIYHSSRSSNGSFNKCTHNSQWCPSISQDPKMLNIVIFTRGWIAAVVVSTAVTAAAGAAPAVMISGNSLWPA